ncbi:unnamed protein product [Ceutorhynchus assimilis]|uniref:C2H2-type domain-containing protein n=1 Tax=Ceutorhynchus assimilis TaxID=467358 RepID=A0A9N9QPK2_9CUCU|nr:unnamed protein product [Ceutorhynchus assimilis]
MDVQSRSIKSDVKCEETLNIMTTKSVKRPFDVAFLMLPDEKLKQKQSRILKNFENTSCYNNNDEDDEEINIEDNEVKVNHQNKYFTQKQQIFDDPTNLIKRKASPPMEHHQKSAFTKVNLSSKDARMSPSLSASPDISYQNSLSPSPPIINSRTYHPSAQNHIFKSSIYQQANFMPENFQHHQQQQQVAAMENHFLATKNQAELNFPKLRPTMMMYRPELAYTYHHQFPNQELHKIVSPAEIRHPAAAILTSLLPPSLAALSLPGQNVCAKCNITFRMTSDLVYHMRSHHKNEASDMNKRRREEKLKCPVCAESFRERHHLTRHMTAHQDKDEDDSEAKKD